MSIEESRLSLDVATHIAGADGQLDIGAFALLTDFALAATIRATHAPHQRLATVSMNMELTGAPLTGRLEAVSHFRGFVREGKGPVGKAEVVVSQNEKTVCIGTGAFMALDPPANVKLHPVPHRKRTDPPIHTVSEEDLGHEEKKILKTADSALAHPNPSFIEAFWGYRPHKTESGAYCTMHNGPHVGNRVGHAQGGVLLGLAASTANATLPATWRLSGVSGWFLRPGEGSELKARSAIVHHGRLTALVHTQVKNPEGSTVIEVMTTHAHR